MNIFDIGFQLSFVSVFAIILMYPLIWGRLQELMPRGKSKLHKFLGQSLAASLAAWLGVAGLVAYYFDIITPVTILANLLVVPLITVIVGLGFGLLVFSPMWPFMSECFAVCVKLAVNLMVFSIFVLDKIPGGCFQFDYFSLWMAVTYYFMLAGGVLSYLRQGRFGAVFCRQEDGAGINSDDYGRKGGKKSV